ncbi:MAG: hypothetical protein NVSMB56_15040 [Pyrinomonadaceae bacterium]
MDIERLAKFVEKPEIHRRILGNYRGAYALGVTRNPQHKDAALSLSVESSDAEKFPREIELDGECVPVIIEPNWSAPRPL